MKKSTLTYVLLIGVAAVWSVLIFRILRTVRGEELSPVAGVVKPHRPVQRLIQQVDTQTLRLNYSDPFFLREGVTAVSQKKDTNHTLLPAPQVLHVVNFVQYEGYLKSAASHQGVAILRVHEKEYMATCGQQLADIKLLQITPGFLLIRYEHRNYFIFNRPQP